MKKTRKQCWAAFQDGKIVEIFLDVVSKTKWEHTPYGIIATTLKKPLELKEITIIY